MHVRVCPKCGNQNKPSLTVCEVCRTSIISVPKTESEGPPDQKTQQVPVMNSAPTQYQQPVQPPAPYDRTIQSGPLPTYSQQYNQNINPGYTPPEPYKGLPKRESQSHGWAIWLISLVVIIGFGLIAWDMFGRPDRGNKGVQNSIAAGKKLRPITTGDTITYDLLASVNVNDNKLTQQSGMGTLIFTFSEGVSMRRYGKNYKTIKLKCDIKGNNDKTMTTEAYYMQDDSGTIYYCGEQDAPGITASLVRDEEKAVYMPSVLSENTSWGYSVGMSDGGTVTAKYKVIGAEWVETPAGKFETYKIAFTESRSKVYEESGTVWVTPDHPFGVKMDCNYKIGDKSSFAINTTIKAELKSCVLSSK